MEIFELIYVFEPFLIKGEVDFCQSELINTPMCTIHCQFQMLMNVITALKGILMFITVAL